jgi:hypothetical protein
LILIFMIAIPFILSSLLDSFFFCNFIPYCLISLIFHIIFGVFFIIILKFDLGVDPYHVPSHGLSRIIGVNWILYCVGSKNDIILINQNNGKKNQLMLTWFFPS